MKKEIIEKQSLCTLLKRLEDVLEAFEENSRDSIKAYEEDYGKENVPYFVGEAIAEAEGNLAAVKVARTALLKLL